MIQISKMDAGSKQFGYLKDTEDNKNEIYSADERYKYRFEESRLKSFDSWPAHYPVNSSRLAKSGFFSTQNGDEVICFSCGGCIHGWQFGDIVQKRHREMFPECEFINNKSDNVHLKANMDLTANVSSSLTGVHSMVEAKTAGFENNLETVHEVSNQKNLLEHIHFSDQNGIHEDNIRVKDLNKFSSGCEKNLDSFPNFEKLILEDERLKTFKCDWPVPYINVLELAKAGFFYLGYGDKVQCPFCRGIISNWEANDIPIVEHSRHFPFCKIVLQFQFSKLDHLKLSDGNTGYDVCGNFDNSSKQQALPDTYKLIDKTQEHTKLEELGVRIYNGPIHPQQATFQARIRSFSSWPEKIPVQKEDLAAAGFFYIGINDHTKCFHCDGGLCYWEAGDDPWVEHARWFRNCSFLHLNKGVDFIRSCVNHTTRAADFKKKSSKFPSSELVINDSLIDKVDEYMKSSLIDAVVEKGVFPLHRIKAVVIKHVQEHGCLFSSADEICEAIIQSEKKSPVDLLEKNESLNNCPSGTNHYLENPTDLKAFSMVEDTQLLNRKAGSEDSSSYLKDQRLCKVCMDRDVGVVFLPCGHLLACTLCATALKDCPWCRKSIQATVKVYLP